MAAISAIAIAGAAVSAIGTGVQMYGANKAAKRAKGQKMTAERKIADLESKRQTVINPYEGITDMSDMVSSVSGMASNPFANLSVSTAAAEMQVEEADIALANTLDTLRATGASAGGATALARMALESKKGVSASIEQQEAQNQQYRARGEERLQNVQMEDEIRVQGAKIGQREKKEEAVAKGLDYKFKTQESRDEQQLNRAQGIVSEASKNEASALNARSQALSSGISAVGGSLLGGTTFKGGSGLGSNK